MFLFRKKAISIFILVIFISTFCGNFTYAQNGKSGTESQYGNKTLLSRETGRVIDNYTAPGSSEHLYIIEDVHCNKEAQKKIAKILEYIEKKEGKIDLIGLEGNTGKLETSIIKLIKNKKIKEKLINSLLDQGYLTGAEIYEIYNDDVTLYGIEDKKLYNKDFEMLYKSQFYKDKIQTITAKTQEAINRAKWVFTEENPKLQEFEAYKSKYNANKISFEQYLQYLIQIHNSDKEFPELAKYLSHRKNLKKINTLRLLEEKDKLEQIVYEKLAEYKDMKDLLYLEKSLKLFNDYINNALSINKVEEYEQRIEQFIQKIKGIGSKISYVNYLETNRAMMGKAYRCMNDFYKLADKRNEVLVKNMLRELGSRVRGQGRGQGHGHSRSLDCHSRESGNLRKGSSLSKSFKESFERSKLSEDFRVKHGNDTQKGVKKIGAMIVGGFHTRRITEILRAKGVSYKIIRPTIRKQVNKDIYLKRLNEQAEIMNLNNMQNTNNSKALVNTSVMSTGFLAFRTGNVLLCSKIVAYLISQEQEMEMELEKFFDDLPEKNDVNWKISNLTIRDYENPVLVSFYGVVALEIVDASVEYIEKVRDNMINMIHKDIIDKSNYGTELLKYYPKCFEEVNDLLTSLNILVDISDKNIEVIYKNSDTIIKNCYKIIDIEETGISRSVMCHIDKVKDNFIKKGARILIKRIKKYKENKENFKKQLLENLEEAISNSEGLTIKFILDEINQMKLNQELNPEDFKKIQEINDDLVNTVKEVGNISFGQSVNLNDIINVFNSILEKREEKEKSVSVNESEINDTKSNLLSDLKQSIEKYDDDKILEILNKLYQLDVELTRKDKELIESLVEGLRKEVLSFKGNVDFKLTDISIRVYNLFNEKPIKGGIGKVTTGYPNKKTKAASLLKTLEDYIDRANEVEILTILDEIYEIKLELESEDLEFIKTLKEELLYNLKQLPTLRFDKINDIKNLFDKILNREKAKGNFLRGCWENIRKLVQWFYDETKQWSSRRVDDFIEKQIEYTGKKEIDKYIKKNKKEKNASDLTEIWGMFYEVFSESAMDADINKIMWEMYLRNLLGYDIWDKACKELGKLKNYTFVLRDLEIGNIEFKNGKIIFTTGLLKNLHSYFNDKNITKKMTTTLMKNIGIHELLELTGMSHKKAMNAQPELKKIVEGKNNVFFRFEKERKKLMELTPGKQKSSSSEKHISKKGSEDLASDMSDCFSFILPARTDIKETEYGKKAKYIYNRIKEKSLMDRLKFNIDFLVEKKGFSYSGDAHPLRYILVALILMFFNDIVTHMQEEGGKYEGEYDKYLDTCMQVFLSFFINNSTLISYNFRKIQECYMKLEKLKYFKELEENHLNISKNYNLIKKQILIELENRKKNDNKPGGKGVVGRTSNFSDSSDEVKKKIVKFDPDATAQSMEYLLQNMLASKQNFQSKKEIKEKLGIVNKQSLIDRLKFNRIMVNQCYNYAQRYVDEYLYTVLLDVSLVFFNDIVSYMQEKGEKYEGEYDKYLDMCMQVFSFFTFKNVRFVSRKFKQILENYEKLSKNNYFKKLIENYPNITKNYKQLFKENTKYKVQNKISKKQDTFDPSIAAQTLEKYIKDKEYGEAGKILKTIMNQSYNNNDELDCKVYYKVYTFCCKLFDVKTLIDIVKKSSELADLFVGLYLKQIKYIAEQYKRNEYGKEKNKNKRNKALYHLGLCLSFLVMISNENSKFAEIVYNNRKLIEDCCRECQVTMARGIGPFYFREFLKIVDKYERHVKRDDTVVFGFEDDGLYNKTEAPPFNFEELKGYINRFDLDEIEKLLKGGFQRMLVTDVLKSKQDNIKNIKKIEKLHELFNNASASAMYQYSDQVTRIKKHFKNILALYENEDGEFLRGLKIFELVKEFYNLPIKSSRDLVNVVTKFMQKRKDSAFIGDKIIKYTQERKHFEFGLDILKKKLKRSFIKKVLKNIQKSGEIDKILPNNADDLELKVMKLKIGNANIEDGKFVATTGLFKNLDIFYKLIGKENAKDRQEKDMADIVIHEIRENLGEEHDNIMKDQEDLKFLVEEIFPLIEDLRFFKLKDIKEYKSIDEYLVKLEKMQNDIKRLTEKLGEAGYKDIDVMGKIDAFKNLNEFFASQKLIGDKQAVITEYWINSTDLGLLEKSESKNVCIKDGDVEKGCYIKRICFSDGWVIRKTYEYAKQNQGKLVEILIESRPVIDTYAGKERVVYNIMSGYKKEMKFVSDIIGMDKMLNILDIKLGKYLRRNNTIHLPAIEEARFMLAAG